MHKEKVSTKSSTNCALPNQPNRSLPLRPPPPAPVRNRPISKSDANKAHNAVKRDELLESDVCEITYDNSNDNSESIESETHTETSFQNAIDVQYLSESKDNHKNTERCKRKLETSDTENCEKSCKKQSKNDRKGTAIKIQELNECSVKLKDVMCMDRLELLSGKSESVTVTDLKHNNESIKLVPPIRLKKVIQEITVNQQKNLSENKNITSEVETSNYKVVSGTVPVSESSSQVSTTLTSNTTSLVPKSYIDNIRITIPSLPELGICKSYEITGPHFVAMMTSKIENTGTQSPKLWTNCAIHEPPITNSCKLKGKINESIESHSIRIFNEDMSEERSVPDYTVTSSGKLTPVISLSKSLETVDHCSKNFSLSFLTNEDAIKLEQILEDSFDISENESFNATAPEEANNYTVNKAPVNKAQEQIIIQFDHLCDKDVMCKAKDDSNNNEKDLSCDEKMLKCRQINLEKKLNELKDKAIALRKKVNSQNKIILQQTMNQYEKQIENLSQLLKKLSSDEIDTTLDEENNQFEKTENNNEETKFRRSMSKSPPKLLPNLDHVYENTDLKEIRNSPPILRRILCPSMIKCKSPSSINADELDCEQSAKPTENVTNCSNLIMEPIFIKDENNDELISARRMIEIHDDDCVEVTLLMKPMKENETKDRQNEDKIVSETSSDFIENLLMLKESNTDDENNSNRAQSILDQDKSDTSPLVIVEDVSLDNQETIANHADSYLGIKNFDIPSTFDKTKEIISTVKISDNQPQTTTFSNHDSLEYDPARNFNGNSFKNLEISLNPIMKPLPKIRARRYVSKKAGQAKMTFSSHAGHGDDVGSNITDSISMNPNILQPTPLASSLDDTNYRTAFNSLSNTSSLSKIYTAPAMHSGGNYSLTNIANYQKDSIGQINEDSLQVASKNIVNEPIVLASHRSRAVNQSKSTVTQNPQAMINNNINHNRPNLLDKNTISDQFPTFGNWAANIVPRDSSRNKKKLVIEPKTNAYSGTSLQNIEVTRSNYMIGNVSYIPRWNAERQLERSVPIITEAHPMQPNIFPPRPRLLQAAPVSRMLPADYTIDQYAPVVSYNSAYPYGSNFPYAPFPAVPALPIEAVRNIPFSPAAVVAHPEKRLPNSPGFRNGIEFAKLPNSMPSSLAEKQPTNLGSEYVRSAAYNNYSILMESQSRPIYKEINVSHHDETNLDQSGQRIPAQDAYVQTSRLHREQQIIAARTMRPRNESLQTIGREISTNPMTTNVLTTSINSSTIYNANSSRMQQMKLPDLMSRNCPTPNMGKAAKNSNVSSMRCYYCGIPNAVFQCLGCETASYCNEICQAQHWNEHVLKCPKIMPKLKKVL